MSFEIVIVLTERGTTRDDDHTHASTTVPIDSLEEGQHAYRQALAAAVAPNPLAAAAKLTGQLNRMREFIGCRAVYYHEGQPTITCIHTDPGHQSKGIKHRGPGDNAVEW